MYRRKIQLIAGTTYSISLPKEWIKKNNLKEKNEVKIFDKNDRTLLISADFIDKELKEITLNVEDYKDNIGQILFAVYYLGIEKITLFSKKEIPIEVKSIIRKTLTHMTGTEISSEDKNKISINVLLDKTKIDLKQLIYRISLVLELSIDNILKKLDLEEIKINENEIDRLYHLAVKIISVAQIESNILQTSKINNISLIPSYFLLCKRLEHIGDNINELALHLKANKIKFENQDILRFAKEELARSIKHILKDYPVIFKKIDEKTFNKKRKEIIKIKDRFIATQLRDMIRYIRNIQEELVNISFYGKLIEDKLL